MLGRYASFLDPFYGLKQVSQSWNLRFDEEVKSLTSSNAKNNPVYTRKLVGVPSLF
jgi:hypothetical protein